MSANETSGRAAQVERKTKETNISVALGLDTGPRYEIQTGLGFFDHMLCALAQHGRFELSLSCEGDLHVDDHHTVEDCALSLGRAFDEALADRKGIRRFGYAYAPLDEALARVVVDFSGRPAPVIELGLVRPMIGDVASENLTHFFESFAATARCALHVDVLRGKNDHHRIEAAFKAFALCLHQATRITGDQRAVPSTKGAL
jgi:imidazoleglycerol phosphate dehydratase HisB